MPAARLAAMGQNPFSTSARAPVWQVKVEEPVKFIPRKAVTGAATRTPAAAAGGESPKTAAQTAAQAVPRAAPFTAKARPPRPRSMSPAARW